MPRDKNKLPGDMLFEFIEAASGNRSWLPYTLRRKISKRFELTTDAQINRKFNELKDDFENDPDKHYIQLFKSGRLTARLIEKFRPKFSEKLEKIFFEKYKDDQLYFRYCEINNIIVDNYEQIVTEVALECKDIGPKKSYLNTLANRRKLCKKWIIQFLGHKPEITEKDSIKTLLENL